MAVHLTDLSTPYSLPPCSHLCLHRVAPMSSSLLLQAGCPDEPCFPVSHPSLHVCPAVAYGGRVGCQWFDFNTQPSTHVSSSPATLPFPPLHPTSTWMFSTGMSLFLP